MAVTTIADHRGEVRVEHGVGRLTKAEAEEGKRNAKVTFDVEGLRIPLTAWVDKSGPLWPRVEWALQHPDAKLWYRIDIHRKSKIDVAIPLADVGNYDKVRDLVALEQPANAQQVSGAPAAAPAQAAQPAAERPAAPPAAQEAQPSPETQPAAQPDPAPGSLDVALKHLEESLRAPTNPAMTSFLIEMAQSLGATEDQIREVADRARPSQQPAPPPASSSSELPTQALAAQRDPDRVGERSPNPPISEGGTATDRPRVSQTSGLSRRTSNPIASDGRPWDATNTDGRLNLSSYAAGAVMEFVNLAGRLLITRARQRANEDPNYDLRAPSRDQIFGLAWQLLNVADRVQHRMRDGGRVDRMASSHKLARQATREALDLFPVPWGADEDTRTMWKLGLTEHALSLVTVGLDILEGRERASRAEPDPEPPSTPPDSDEPLPDEPPAEDVR